MSTSLFFSVLKYFSIWFPYQAKTNMFSLSSQTTAQVGQSSWHSRPYKILLQKWQCSISFSSFSHSLWKYEKLNFAEVARYMEPSIIERETATPIFETAFSQAWSGTRTPCETWFWTTHLHLCGIVSVLDSWLACLLCIKVHHSMCPIPKLCHSVLLKKNR